MRQGWNSSFIGRFALSVSTCGLLAICALNPGASRAQNVPITNYSFEGPALAPGDFTAFGINGWTSAAVTTGVWNPGPGGPLGPYFHTGAPDGAQIGFINNSGTISQQLAAPLQAGTYNLSAFFGNRLDGVSTGDTLELWAGGTASGGLVTGGTELASNQIAITDIAPGFFAPLSVFYVATGSDPLLGQALSIRMGHLNNLDNGQSEFDNVNLTFNADNSQVTPEGSSLLTLTAGLLTLMAVGLRRRK